MSIVNSFQMIISYLESLSLHEVQPLSQLYYKEKRVVALYIAYVHLGINFY